MQVKWEWLSKKTSDIVRRRYKDGTIKGYDREDIVQEVLMYLMDSSNSDYADKIYEQESFAMLHQIVRTVIFRLSEKNSFLNFRERGMVAVIQKACEQYNIEQVSANAYKVAAVLQQNSEISAASKKTLYSLASIERIMKLCEENTEYAEVPFDEITEKELVQSMV